MSNFEEKIKDLIKSYFPDTEWVPSITEENLPEVLGLDPAIKQEELKYDYYHFYSEIESNFLTEEEIKEEVIDELKKLRFFKTPDEIYWRLAGYIEGHDFDSDKIIRKAIIRFSLGYKL